MAFEPLRGPFDELADAARRDSRLSVHQCALGAEEGEAIIHVSANCYSSSLLRMHDAHFRAAPDSAYIGDERVQVRSLDSLSWWRNTSRGSRSTRSDTSGTYWRGQNERFGVYPRSRSNSATSPSMKGRRSPAKSTKC